ncbi:unnamed protein product [Closterium sp. Yama58-4]|nr:unnamed protein product [Closterium sp. Yama58-4]
MLFNNSLYGSLPPTLWNPTKLTFVEVSSNYLNGSVPQPPAGRSAQFSHSSNCLEQTPSQRPTDQCSRFYSNVPALIQSGTPSPSLTLLGTAARASTPTCPLSCNPVAIPFPSPPLSPPTFPLSPFPSLLSPLIAFTVQRCSHGTFYTSPRVLMFLAQPFHLDSPCAMHHVPYIMHHAHHTPCTIHHAP